MDIEGAENELLLDDAAVWLERVRMMIIEMHPTIVDRPRIIERLVDRGFQAHPADTPRALFPGAMPNLIQIIPAASESNAPRSLFGLEEGGRLWYGWLIKEGGQNDPGPTAIAWRPIEEK